MPNDDHSILVRFVRLESARRRLAIEAAASLATIAVRLGIQPFRSAIRYGSVPLSSREGAVDDCVWAVEAVARRLPWRPVCIDKGLVLQRMVRRRGHDAQLHYGIGKDDSEGELQAHVWVTLDGMALIGGNEADGFAPVAVYP